MNTPESHEFYVTSLEEFAAFEEPGAEALIGGEDSVLIPEGGDVMVYGDGGAGKTTLTIDLALHLAAGEPWLGIRVARAVRVLVIENEGPRPSFRAKLRRKLATWAGEAPEERIAIFEEPWGTITFTDPSWRSAVAEAVRDGEIDVLIAGPVTRLGMDEAGTLQQVRDFMRLISEARTQSGRRLVVILVHHENKGGAVSGAWEGSGDTLLHVEAHRPGHTCLHVQKARWSSLHHGTTLDLAWTDGEGFTVEDARNYYAEIVDLLADRGWRTAREIANKRDHKDKPGIGASVETVQATLKQHPNTFLERNGKEVGRHRNATVYGLHPAEKSDDADGLLQGAANGSELSVPPLRGTDVPSAVPTLPLHPYSAPSSDARQNGYSDNELQALIDHEQEQLETRASAAYASPERLPNTTQPLPTLADAGDL